MAESSSNKLPPPSGDENCASPRTAWAQVVRGAEPEVMPAGPKSSPPPPSSVGKTVEQAASPDCSASEETRPENADANHRNAGHPKKAAWNKPLNGVIEVGPVMGGATAWPALSESARSPMKSTPDSPSPLAEASVSSSQGTVISNSPPNQDQGSSTTPNTNVTRNNTGSARQRSSRRGGGGAGGAPTRGGFSRNSTPNPPPPPSQLPSIPVPPPFPLYEMPFGPLGPAVPYVSQPHPVNVQSPQRSSPRRGNFGGRPRGDGPHQDNHGNRRGQDRDWNASRNSHARDGHAPPQIVPPSDFLAPPPSPPHLIPPHAMRPFANPMGFDMTAPFFYVPAMPPMPFVPPPPMLYPMVAPPLPTVLINQIDYYFSDSNLARDNFLRSNMDDEGWVPVSLIADFPRVKKLTDNIELILDSIKASQVVEVEGNKIRKRNEWRKWVPNSGRLSADPSSQSSPDGTLTTSLEKVTLHELTTNQSNNMGKADLSTEEMPPSESLVEDSKIDRSKVDGVTKTSDPASSSET